MSIEFRQEALAARQQNKLGEVVLIRPLSFAILTTITSLFAMGLLMLLVWGSYTKRSTVGGELLPSRGLIKVYAPQTAVVLHKKVQEGQAVSQGQILYELSSERSNSQGDIQARISAEVSERRRSLQDELEKTRWLQQEEHAVLDKKVRDLRAELAALNAQLAGQLSRVELAQSRVARYQDLLAQGFISQEQLQQKQEELLEQRNHWQGLKRERISLGRELDAQQAALAALEPQQHNQQAQLMRQLSSLGQEWTESEGKRQLLVRAPEAGIVTAIHAEAGQAVDGSRPLLSIVPRGAHLQAHLYAPSRAIGFVKTGDSVLLRYQAYPYQKFGHAHGKVQSVSRTAMSAAELSQNGPSTGGSPEPVYRITVELAHQHIQAYGQQHLLQAGMSLEADVLQETRRLYEWVLEPLYSMGRKL